MKRVGKRGRKGWRKRNPRCCICTPHRIQGNTRVRFNHSTNVRRSVADDQVKEVA